MTRIFIGAMVVASLFGCIALAGSGPWGVLALLLLFPVAATLFG